MIMSPSRTSRRRSRFEAALAACLALALGAPAAGQSVSGYQIVPSVADPRVHDFDEPSLALVGPHVRADAPLHAADFSTEEYPGFPTDMQGQFMALATQAEGVSVVKENIFENRFMHVQELIRMGANIKLDGRSATIRGKTPLSAAAVMCSDLRASASLVLAALVADGESILDRVYHMDRGYEHIEEKLRGVGAQIRRLGDIFADKREMAVTA